MLLLSTSDCIFWLARQTERMICFEYLHEAQTYDRVIKDPEGYYSGFYFYPCQSLGGSSAKSYRTKEIPKLAEQIQSNVQQVRGVISQDTFELFNLVKRLCDSGSYRAASFQIEACRAAMNFENETVRLFWQLGVYSERIELAFQCDKSIDKLTVKLNQTVQKLPANTRWQELMRPADRLTTTGSKSDFDLYQSMFADLIAEGI